MPVSKPRKRKRGPRRRQPTSKPSQRRGPPADIRAPESVTKSLARGFTPQPETDLDQAQDLVYEAWERTGEARLALARAALDITEDCADAWVILAEAATSLHEKRALFEQGMIAGERALGPEVFAQDAGHFWGLIETRGYMRARFGFSLTIHALGDRSEAIDHLQDLLRLNPNDSQGARYMLLSFLLGDGRDEEARALLESADYAEDAGAHWTYGRALALLRRDGDSQLSRTALAEARRSNPQVLRSWPRPSGCRTCPRGESSRSAVNRRRSPARSTWAWRGERPPAP